MGMPSEETLKSFNKLIYEYLVKMKYKKTVSAFQSETGLSDIQLNDAPPTLLNWYNIFLETADVRSGKISIPESLNRIEGIMLRLENEKQRFAKIGRAGISDWNTQPISSQYPWASEEYVPGYGVLEDYSSANPGVVQDSSSRAVPVDDRGYPYGYEDVAPTSNSMLSSQGYGQLKESKRLELKIPYIVAAKHCPTAELLISCCTDGVVYFYSIANNAVECTYSLPKKHLHCLKTIETHDSIFIIYAFDDKSLHLCRYFNGRNEDLKVIGSDVAIRSFCFGRNTVFVLAENAVLKIYSFMGDLLRSFRISPAILKIEFFGKNLLLVESTRVVEFDVNMNMEIKTLIRGARPSVIVKDEFAFIVLPDAVCVYTTRSQHPVATVNCTLEVKDIDFAFGKVILCTSDEVYCGMAIYQVPNALLVSSVRSMDFGSCILLTADGWLIFYSQSSSSEYV